ncbi:hypothetical protein TcBrA4_0088490 [Trypanosoma cruzi]|nr:hypothetical protein TcBrA4_0088490 [Trypanosoma cruzi]
MLLPFPFFGRHGRFRTEKALKNGMKVWGRRGVSIRFSGGKIPPRARQPGNPRRNPGARLREAIGKRFASITRASDPRRNLKRSETKKYRYKGNADIAARLWGKPRFPASPKTARKHTQRSTSESPHDMVSRKSGRRR